MIYTDYLSRSPCSRYPPIACQVRKITGAKLETPEAQLLTINMKGL